jgi:FHS family L-fucose permease-like MFS transporter
VALCLFAMTSPNMAGVVALVAVSFCLSLMFPTIYGVALKGLGPATKFGAAGLVMAIVGGAIMPLVQGKLVDATSPAFSFIVPAGCFVVVGLYALYDLRAGPSVIGGEPAREIGPAAHPALPPQPAGGAA